MLSILGFDFMRVEGMIRECKAELGLSGKTHYECIYRSNEFYDQRFVFKVTIGEQVVALKVDYASPNTGRLQREFETLKVLNTHFSSNEKLVVPEPFYMSSSNRFFVMRYLSGRTATVAIRGSENSQSIGQVYRRAGHWLQHLHQFTGYQEVKLWPNWMSEAIDVATEKNPQATPSEYGLMVEQLRSQLKGLAGTPALKVFSHGDFHSSNVILTKGKTCGFDFTEVTEKLAVYDIVDFLKSDIYWTDAAHEIDGSGVSQRCKEMFFRRYRHPLDHDVLDLCLRGRLLIDWMNISKSRYEKSAFQRDKFARLKARLEIAFRDS